VQPTLFFVHGTGGRDVSGTVTQIERGVAKVLNWSPKQVIPIEWGKHVAPKERDIRAVLPPHYTRGIEGADIAGDDDVDRDDVSLWEVLLADPTAELKTLTFHDPDSISPDADDVNIFNPALSPPGQSLEEALRDLKVAGEVLENAGVTPKQLSDAGERLADSGAVADAAARIDIPNTNELAEQVARSVVAFVLQTAMLAPIPDTNALYDVGARDALVQAVTLSLAPAGAQARGVTDKAKGFIVDLAFKMATKKRVDFMTSANGFLRDIAFYIQRGDEVRDYIAKQLRQHPGEGPVILLGHSLGGIACVDLLADPAVMSGADPLRVDLLVTVGSQAPYLFQLDALYSLRPDDAAVPFQPWLNIYDEEDLLSFCAQRVFNFPGARIFDEQVDTGVPFSLSHSAYWNVDRVWELVQQRLHP
jgi:hypothetical protein